jgi:hypothetical protein
VSKRNGASWDGDVEVEVEVAAADEDEYVTGTSEPRNRAMGVVVVAYPLGREEAMVAASLAVLAHAWWWYWFSRRRGRRVTATEEELPSRGRAFISGLVVADARASSK